VEQARPLSLHAEIVSGALGRETPEPPKYRTPQLQAVGRLVDMVISMDKEFHRPLRLGNGTIPFDARSAYANISMYRRMKDLTWLADSRSRVKSFPASVQDDIG